MTVRCCWQKYEQERDLGSHRLKYCQRFIIGRINGPGIPCISFVSVPRSTRHPFLSAVTGQGFCNLAPKETPTSSITAQARGKRRKEERSTRATPRGVVINSRGRAMSSLAFSLIPRRTSSASKFDLYSLLRSRRRIARRRESRRYVDSLFNIESHSVFERTGKLMVLNHEF